MTDDTGTISKVIIPSGASAGTYLPTWNGHGDALALYRIETDGSLTLANSYSYSTWGSPTTATHNGIADLRFRFLYVGAADVQWDAELGLHYMHARHYSPTLGRFLQPDPSRLDAQLFVYAGNGPVSRVDPDGTNDRKNDVTGGFAISGNGAAAKVARAVQKVVEPFGRPIGKAGTNARIRIVSGGIRTGYTLLTKMLRGGIERIYIPRPGTIVFKLEHNAGFITFRVRSSTPPHGPTIDINVPGVWVQKIKLQ